MPIRFACTRCRQALQIASRKAGATIKCPKCQAELTVPMADAAAGEPINQVSQAAPQPPAAKTPTATAPAASRVQATPRERQSAAKPEIKRDNPTFSSLHIEIAPEDIRPAKLEPDAPSVIVFDDVSAALDMPATPRAAAPAPRAPVAGPVPFDPRLVAVSRTVLYAQAVLIAVVAILSFGIGYFAGRGVRQPSPEELLANRQPVLVEGDVVYRAGGGDLPDVGAVVIALPHDRALGQKLTIKGLKPGEPQGPEGGIHPSVQAVESEGGSYVRADQNGQFRLNLRPGKYWVLALSAASTRPAGVLPTIHDVKTLGRYFENATDLLADRRYLLVAKQLPEDAPLEIALDAQP